MHVDDWIDSPTDENNENEALAKAWLGNWRRPAVDHDQAWHDMFLVSGIFQCKSYRVIGCSRMGDVWLTPDFGRTHGYDLRVDVSEISNWKVTRTSTSQKTH